MNVPSSQVSDREKGGHVPDQSQGGVGTAQKEAGFTAASTDELLSSIEMSLSTQDLSAAEGLLSRLEAELLL